MKLGMFVKMFSHNNIIRLHYKTKGGHILVHDSWDDVSMDHDVNNAKGKNRHYLDNEVLGLISISNIQGAYPEALNIVIDKIENQPFVQERSTNDYQHGDQ